MNGQDDGVVKIGMLISPMAEKNSLHSEILLDSFQAENCFAENCSGRKLVTSFQPRYQIQNKTGQPKIAVYTL